MNIAAQISHIYFQLKSGHTVTGTYLRRMGRAGSNQYWECTSHVRMDVHHALLNYKTWQREKTEMLKKCEKDTGSCPSTVRQLLQ